MPTILITGANRGIGLESARQYAADGWQVVGCCRDPRGATDLAAIDGVTVLALDVTDGASIDALAAKMDAPVDVLMNNAGQTSRPRPDFGAMDYAQWADLFAVNTLAPYKMAEAFHDHVRRSDRKTILNVSSIMGSIADASGGHVAYRSTKAALNMVTKTLAADLGNDGITVLAVHPGWVRTDMGGPSAAISPEESAAGMKRVVEGARLTDSGGFVDWKGETIPW